MGNFYRRQSFGVTIGKDYIVLGITFAIRSNLFGTGAVVQFQDDDGNIGFAPICIFEITDGAPSKYWVARLDEDGSLTFQPPSFYKEYYHDDLSSGEEDVRKDFEVILSLLKNEINNSL